MTSKQYEELCRFFLAEKFQIGVDRVLSLNVINPQRLGLSEYAHQIDLYWEIETPVARYLHIANAKWRTPPYKVDQGEVLLLQQIKCQLAAHKAFVLTNVGFDEGAQAAAADQGIGLHVVCPGFNTRRLHSSDPAIIQSQLQSQSRLVAARPVYLHELIRKGVELPGSEALVAPPVLLPSDTGQQGGSVVPPAITPQPTPGGGTAAPPGGGGFHYLTKQGPFPGLRRK